MKNKTVIRKELKKGGFTSIHNSIILDKRLSQTAFRLLVLVLSDSDEDFDFSETVYINRLDVTKKTLLAAIENLIECGYLKKTPIEGMYNKNYYTFSEFGNLKTSTDKEINKKDDYQTNDDYENKIGIIEDYYYEYIYSNEDLKEKLIYEVTKMTDTEKIEKMILKHRYNSIIESLREKDKFPKALKRMEGYLKDLIFNKKQLNIPSSKWLLLKKEENKSKIDYETKMSDYYENPID